MLLRCCCRSALPAHTRCPAPGACPVQRYPGCSILHAPPPCLSTGEQIGCDRRSRISRLSLPTVCLLVRAAPGRKVKEARVLGHSVHRRELRPALRVDGGDKQGKRHLVSGVDQLVQPSQVRLELLSMLHASHHRVSNMRSTSSGPPITSATLSSSSSRRRCAKTESTANSAISRPPRVFHRLGGQ